jgi:hypothetical protein
MCTSKPTIAVASESHRIMRSYWESRASSDSCCISVDVTTSTRGLSALILLLAASTRYTCVYASVFLSFVKAF